MILFLLLGLLLILISCVIFRFQWLGFRTVCFLLLLFLLGCSFLAFGQESVRNFQLSEGVVDSPMVEMPGYSILIKGENGLDVVLIDVIFDSFPDGVFTPVGFQAVNHVFVVDTLVLVDAKVLRGLFKF